MKEEKPILDFKVPRAYFETFEERLFTRIAEDKFPKSSGLQVPKGYFEEMEKTVLKTVFAETGSKKTIPLYAKIPRHYVAAIAACLVIGFVIFNWDTGNTDNLNLQLAAIDNYIEAGNLDLDLYDITFFIDDETIANTYLDWQQFSDSSLREYLLENLDTEILINPQ